MNTQMVAWTVKAIDSEGKVQYEQTFENRSGFIAEEAAKRNAFRIARLFEDCVVTLNDVEFLRSHTNGV